MSFLRRILFASDRDRMIEVMGAHRKGGCKESPLIVDVKDSISHLIGIDFAILVTIQNLESCQGFVGWKEVKQILKDYVIPAVWRKSI